MSCRSAKDTRRNVEYEGCKKHKVLGELYRQGTIGSCSAEKFQKLVVDDAKHAMVDTRITVDL